jgi:IclR family transcriptional regulator, acetate operon repressor
MGNVSGLESVDNALRLLLLLAERESVRVSEVAAELDIAPSTAHRLLSTLRQREFVEQEADRRYLKGAAFARLGLPVPPPPRPIEELAVPHLERLRDELGETAHLSVLEGTEIRFLASVESSQVLRVGSRAGARLPAHLTSAGKALLAALPHQELAKRFPPEGVASLGLTGTEVEALARDLQGVRRRGYGVNRGEGERGVAAVGVSLVGADGTPVGALSISVPTVRLNAARVREMASRLMQEKAAFEAELTS